MRADELTLVWGSWVGAAGETCDARLVCALAEVNPDRTHRDRVGLALQACPKVGHRVILRVLMAICELVSSPVSLVSISDTIQAAELTGGSPVHGIDHLEDWNAQNQRGCPVGGLR